MANFHVSNPYRSSPLLNSDPYTNLYLKQQSEKVAKEKAFDGYLNDLAKNVTPAGMRTQDVPSFTSKATEWQKFGIENKKAIQNPAIDGGAARSQFMGMHQELLGRTATSKSELEKAKGLRSIYNNPDILRRVTPTTFQKWSRANLPVDHPDFEPLDTSDVEYKAKPFEMRDENELNKYLLNGIDTKPSYVGRKQDPNDRYKQIEVYEYKHNPKTLQTIGEKSYGAFESNESFRDKIIELSDKLSPRPNQYDKGKIESPAEGVIYHDLFKKAYGRDIEGDEDWARAYGLVVADRTSRMEKPAVDTGALLDRKFNDAVKLKGIDFNNRLRAMKVADGYKRAFKNFSAAEDAGQSENAINDLISEQYNSGQELPVVIGGRRYEGKMISVSSDIKKKYTIYDAAGVAHDPDVFVLTKDKKTVVPIFFKKDASGNPLPASKGSPNKAIDGSLSKPFTLKEYKANIAKDFLTRKDWTDAQLDEYYEFGEGNTDEAGMQVAAPAPATKTRNRPSPTKSTSGVKWK